MKVNDLSVLPFADFRAFLNAYAQEMKNRQPMWSFGAWSKHLGLSTTSSLTKVLRGERNPGPRMVEKFIEYFSFSPEEEVHFRELVSLKKLSRDPRLSALLAQNVASRKKKDSARIISEPLFSRLAEWQCFAIREMVNLKNFTECPKWISEKLCQYVSDQEVKEAIQKLLNVGLLARDSSGRLCLSSADVDTASDIPSDATKRYHEQSLDNAKLALSSVPCQEREFTSSVFVIDKSRIPEVKAMIREFREKLMRSFEQTNGDEVYQLQVSFFPLTKSGDRAKDESSLLH